MGKKGLSDSHSESINIPLAGGIFNEIPSYFMTESRIKYFVRRGAADNYLNGRNNNPQKAQEIITGLMNHDRVGGNEEALVLIDYGCLHEVAYFINYFSNLSDEVLAWVNDSWLVESSRLIYQTKRALTEGNFMFDETSHYSYRYQVDPEWRKEIDQFSRNENKKAALQNELVQMYESGSADPISGHPHEDLAILKAGRLSREGRKSFLRFWKDRGDGAPMSPEETKYHLIGDYLNLFEKGGKLSVEELKKIYNSEDRWLLIEYAELIDLDEDMKSSEPEMYRYIKKYTNNKDK